MKVWIGGEVGLNDDDFDRYRIATNKIEKKINNYLEEIEYKNVRLINWDIIIILRDDAVFNEIKKYNKRKKNTDIRLKIDYNAFKNGNNEERENLIFDVLLRSLNVLEEKGIEDLEVVKEFIDSCKY
jgi:hypothetical protein